MKKRVAGILVSFLTFFMVAVLGAQAGFKNHDHLTDQPRSVTMIADAESTIGNKSSAVSADPVIYDSGMLAITPWKMDLCTQNFKSAQTQSGYLLITKNAPELNITAGLLIFNHRPISLTSFLRGEEASLKIKVRVKRINHLKVFIIGASSASIRITVHAEAKEQPLPHGNVFRFCGKYYHRR